MYDLLRDAQPNSADPNKTYYLLPNGEFVIANRANYEQVKEGGGRQILSGSQLNNIIQQKRDEKFADQVNAQISAQTAPQIADRKSTV